MPWSRSKFIRMRRIRERRCVSLKHVREGEQHRDARTHAVDRMLAREKKRVPDPARSINNNIRLTNNPRLRPAVAQSVVSDCSHRYAALMQPRRYVMRVHASE